MSATRYRQFLKICEKWPVDPSKSAKRDIGVLLRKRIGVAFKSGENSTITDVEKCDKMYASLDAICSDKYKKMYPRNKNVLGSVGEDYEKIHYYASEEGMEELSR